MGRNVGYQLFVPSNEFLSERSDHRVSTSILLFTIIFINSCSVSTHKNARIHSDQSQYIQSKKAPYYLHALSSLSVINFVFSCQHELNSFRKNIQNRHKKR